MTADDPMREFVRRLFRTGADVTRRVTITPEPPEPPDEATREFISRLFAREED